MTTIFVAHDTDEALKLGDQIAVLRDGEIRQVADPETIYKRLRQDFVKICLEVLTMSKLLPTFQDRFWGMARCIGATFATVITDLAPLRFFWLFL